MRVALLVLLTACSREPNVPEPARPPAPPTPPPVVVETAPKGTCTPTPLAANTGKSIQILELTATCDLKVINSIDTWVEGSKYFDTEIVDIAWPHASGPLHVVANRDGTWLVASLANPRSATATDFDQAVWTQPPKLGRLEPEGHEFGVEDDGGTPVLTGCAKWSSDDAEGEVEEWECLKPLFRTLDKKLVATPPVPAHGTPWKPGVAVPGAELRVHKNVLECKTGSGDWKTWKRVGDFVPNPLAIAPRGDRYFLLGLHGGSRMNANIHVGAIAMTGCERDAALPGEIVIGPGGIYAHRDDPYRRAPWSLHRVGAAMELDSIDAIQLVFTRQGGGGVTSSSSAPSPR